MTDPDSIEYDKKNIISNILVSVAFYIEIVS